MGKILVIMKTMEFIRKEYFKISILVILFVFALLYFRNNKSLETELYRLNTDCSRSASLFAKEKGDEFFIWEVLQSFYKVDKQSCFAEFKTANSGWIIFDLTHSKELAFEPKLVFNETATYTELAKKYEATKLEVFGGGK
jgi:hypothetical protein